MQLKPSAVCFTIITVGLKKVSSKFLDLRIKISLLTEAIQRDLELLKKQKNENF